MKSRKSIIQRNTEETKIEISLELDNSKNSNSKINTGIGFLDHMLEQIAKHAQLELSISCQGDTHIDFHHSTEDLGIAFGQALSEALLDKKGIKRYGHFYCPLDEALTRVVMDLSGRPGLFFNVCFPTQKIGNFDSELVQEFFQGFCNHAKATIHIDNLAGTNSHHIAETIFKAFAKALQIAISYDPNSDGKIPSTKGIL